MEQPKMPLLRLSLQKDKSYNYQPLLLTQGDKGYLQQFTLTDIFAPFEATEKTLGFRAMKPDRTFIEVENEPERFSKVDDVWQFTLPDELTQSVGTVSGAYFYVKSGSTVVASTTKFNYEISPKWGEEEQSNSYVTKLEKLGKKLQDYVNAGAQTITVLNDYGEEARTNLSDSLASLTSEVTAWKAKTTSDIDATLASKKAALDKLQADFNEKYNQVSTLYVNAQAEWTTKKSDYDKEFTANQTKNKQDFDAEIAKIETEKTTALATISDDAKAKIADIQSQTDAKLSDIQTDWNALKTSLNAEIQALTDKVTTTDGKADEIKTRLDALAAQLDSIDIVGVKKAADKATADVATLTKSTVKSATVNGGSKVTPDTAGNLALTVPSPDLSTYALKTQLPNLTPYATTAAMTEAISAAQPDLSPYAKIADLPSHTGYETDLPSLTGYATTAAMNTALSSAKSYADTKKSEAQSYTDTKISGMLKSWTGTQAQYDEIVTKDSNTLYIIKEVV